MDQTKNNTLASRSCYTVCNNDFNDCCNKPKQFRNKAETLWCAENRSWEFAFKPSGQFLESNEYNGPRMLLLFTFRKNISMLL